MQIPGLEAALLAALPTGAGVSARIVSGNLTGVPLGALLRATVTAVTAQNATLTVNGQVLTVRQPTGVQLQPGAVLLIRVPPGAATATNPALELVGPAPTAAPPQGGVQAGGAPAPQGGAPAPAQPVSLPATPPTPARVPPEAPPASAAQPSGRRPAPQADPPAIPTSDPASAPVGRATTADVAVPRATDPGTGAVSSKPPAVPSSGTAPAPVGGTTTAGAGSRATSLGNGTIGAQPPAVPSSGTAPVPVVVPPTAGVGPRPATNQPVESVGPQPRLAVVDVLAPPSNGRVQVTLDGTELTAATVEPLVAGGRYVLQVNRTPTGVVLTAPPDGSVLPTELATALLRAPAPELTAALEPLRTELAALASPQPGTTAAPVPDAVRAAATAVTATLGTFVPSDLRPPNAAELQSLVADGGRHFEAKLARLIADSTLPTTDASAPARPGPRTTPTDVQAARQEATGTGTALPRPADKPVATGVLAEPTALQQTATEQPPGEQQAADQQSATPDHAADPTSGIVGPDLKGDLLRLLQAVKELGGAVPAPAAENALHGIEAQQAAQALAQAAGSPYFLQIPFPDGGQWRTLHLALEPQNRPDDPNSEQPGRFRVFMHVPLTDLGETWIDAGLSGDRFRATIYLDRPAVRDRVRAALGELGTELKSDGFSEVLLDVRASSELPSGRRREAGALVAGRPDTVSVLDVRV